MSDVAVLLAVEDMVGQALSQRLLSHFGISVGQTLGLSGKGHLKKAAGRLNKVAPSVPVFMLADLDRPLPCPAEVIRSWVRGPCANGFILRLAVMEAESWVLADRRGFSGYLGVPIARIPACTDSIPNPKEFIVTLARRARSKRLRADMVPEAGASTKVGPVYNARLLEFIYSRWDVESASGASPSLKRAMARVRTFKGQAGFE